MDDGYRRMKLKKRKKAVNRLRTPENSTSQSTYGYDNVLDRIKSVSSELR